MLAVFVIQYITLKYDNINEQTVYASTSGRRMDADKGPKERSVYPSVCWAVDDYADVFITFYYFCSSKHTLSLRYKNIIS